MSERKVLISADSTCDLGKELQQQYQIPFFPFHILIGENSYVDGKDITPEEIYTLWRTRRLLPKTAAITMMEYYEFFRTWVEKGYDVVHINLGSAISSAHQNCVAAATKLEHVYPVDSCSLSTGTGLLVLKAAQWAREEMPAEEIQKKLRELTPCVRASFVLDTLEFMRAGGRCSAVAAVGANLLQLRPCIQVEPGENGAMKVGKKYRGSMKKVLQQYVEDQLKNASSISLDRLFITHSGCPQEWIDAVKQQVEQTLPFREIHITQASCTISSHCGPGTLGILFLEEKGE